MTSFDSHFPDCAGRERLVLHVQQPGLPLPPGEYGFFEFYCERPDCDCRRALLQVISPQHPGRILAIINYGWESEAFYTEWIHGDAEAGREITEASLDPMNPQSELADALLDGFRDHVRRDPSCPQQLRRHYELFKSTQHTRPPSSMTPGEILRQLEHVPDKCDFAPYQTALLAAPLHREALVPQLIAALDRVSANPAHYLKHQDDSLHHFAIYLLAQFRETRALDAFVRFFSLPGEDALDLTNDTVTENGAAVIASVCGGDPAPLLRLAQDESVNMFVRQQAIDALLVQAGWRERPREAVIADLRQLFDTLPKPGDAYVWASLVSSVYDFQARELLPESRRVLDQGLADEDIVSPEFLDDLEWPERSRFPPPPGKTIFDVFMERNAPIEAVDECCVWLCFRDDTEADDDWDAPDFISDEDSPEEILNAVRDTPPFEPPPKPYVAPPKTGRNDPCPCGSGKKYKKCCGK
jgi:hypothetical protein